MSVSINSKWSSHVLNIKSGHVYKTGKTHFVGLNGRVESSKCPIDVTVTDVNDEQPAFHDPDVEKLFEISENLGNTLLGVISATDADASAELVFSIALESAENHLGVPDRAFNVAEHFAITSSAPTAPGKLWEGHLSVTKALDFEQTAEIQIAVIVRDKKAQQPVEQTAKISVKIKVEDLNDNKPVLRFDNSIMGTEIVQQVVPEYTTGVIVLDFAATDADTKPITPPFHVVLKQV